MIPGLPCFARAASSSSRPAPLPAGHEFLFHPGTAQVPHQLMLGQPPLKCQDLGGCGIWNQFEFCLFLKSVTDLDLDKWKVFRMDATFESCDRMCVTKVLAECEREKATMPPPEVTPAEEDKEEWQHFMTFLLQPNTTATAQRFDPHPGSDNDSFQGDLEEQEHPDDFDAFQEVVGVGTGSENEGEPAPRPGRPRDREDDGEGSRAGSNTSRASGDARRPHQQATDVDIIKRVLGARPGIEYEMKHDLMI